MKVQLLLWAVLAMVCVWPVMGQVVDASGSEKDDNPSLEPMMAERLGEYDAFPAGAKEVWSDERPYWRGLVSRSRTRADDRKIYSSFFVKQGNGYKKVKFVGQDELTPEISALAVTSKTAVYNCEETRRESGDTVYITKKRVSNAKCPHPVHDEKALQQRIEKIVGIPVNAAYVESLGQVAIQATLWDESKTMTSEQKASWRVDQLYHRAGDLGISMEVLDKAVTIFAPEFKKRWSEAMEWESFH